MAWRSLVELLPVIKAFQDSHKLEDIFFLSEFLRNAFVPDGYTPDIGWEHAVSLSEVGRAFVERVPDVHNKYTPPTIHAAVFAHLYHHELLIDPANTDTAHIRRIINSDLQAWKLRWPYRNGRLLYDRFNDTYSGSRTDHLTATEATSLLAGTPQGVYQLGKLVWGPLGTIDSQEDRVLPPTLEIPLWHCSDTGCNAIHDVELISAHVPFTKAYDEMATANEEHSGPPSEWSEAFRVAHNEVAAPEGRPYYDASSIISDTIIDTERTSLVTLALKSGSADALRAVLQTTGKKPRGSPEEIAKQLSGVEQHQLLLVLRDADLVKTIDTAVRARKIQIPASEIRAARYIPPRRRSLDVRSELSSIGIRPVHDDPVIVVASLIYQAYRSLDKLDDLAWSLRRYSTPSTREGLLAYIRAEGPESAVRALVLSSKPASAAICTQLGLDFQDGADDTSLLTRILWKCGFDLPRYEERYTRLRKHLSSFNDTLLALSEPLSDDQQAQVRSSGVNLFVVAEPILDELVTYSCWLLASDHFADTRFIYDQAAAKAVVVRVLGAELESDTVKVAWTSTGNTLGVSLRYLKEIVSWLRSLPEKDKEPLARKPEDLPHFAIDKFHTFPFAHTQLWADTDAMALRAYTDRLSEIADILFKARLDAVRNGLDHHRDEGRFPGLDEMLACVARMQQAFERMDSGRYLPKTFWLERYSGDRFGSQEYQLRDYMGKDIPLYGPAWVSGGSGIPIGRPVIVAPGNLLGLPNSSLIFRVRERSPYADYWADYPRRRRIHEPEGSSAAELEPLKSTVVAPGAAQPEIVADGAAPRG